MLDVIADGENRFRLKDSRGRERGWIRGRAVRFTGVSSEAHAMQSARAAWHALERFLRLQFLRRPLHREALGELRLIHDGAYEWISDGQVPVARLVRPAADGSSESYAIEFVVPASAGSDVTIGAARAIAAALDDQRTHGLSVPNDVHAPSCD